MTWEQWVSIIALVLALAAVIVGMLVLRWIRIRGARVPALAEVERLRQEHGSGPPAFVVNPVKVTHLERFRSIVHATCQELGLGEPLWFTTTVQDPGLGQAERALAERASVVVAVGGDGTVRAVATALAGTGVPMGLVPMGTGNLLARNVDLPLEDTRGLIHTALTGTEQPIDVGWIRPRELLSVEQVEGVDAAQARPPGTGPDEGQDAAGSVEKVPPDALARRNEHLFLVMGGIGFDAAMVAGADDDLKARVGWFAYFFAGVQHLHGRKIKVQMQLGDAPAHQLRLRTLLFANCGRLPGGMVLFPDAELDDGWLDIAAIDTRRSVIGWASLFGKVVLQGLGVRRESGTWSTSSITFWRGRDVHVRCPEPEPIQVDGDLIGETQAFSVRVDHRALVLRVRG
ncbi:MAG TPA: diacylglycerol kinase family protein [Beutenbergiaceae bacterium]|nr:diacylglycerol kinase family protein [Beutenbergiaceae bacterium]